MSRADDIAQLLIETGHDWSARELALHFYCTINSIQSSMTKVRRLCTLKESTATSKAYSRPEIRYSAIVDRGVGLLAMNKPRNRYEPSVVYKPND